MMKAAIAMDMMRAMARPAQASLTSATVTMRGRCAKTLKQAACQHDCPTLRDHANHAAKDKETVSSTDHGRSIKTVGQWPCKKLTTRHAQEECRDDVMEVICSAGTHFQTDNVKCGQHQVCPQGANRNQHRHQNEVFDRRSGWLFF
nr:hypothetical protein [Roseobacter sp. H9]